MSLGGRRSRPAPPSAQRVETFSRGGRAKPWVSDQGTPTTRRFISAAHDVGMFLHEWMKLDLARARQRELVARAARDCLKRGGSPAHRSAPATRAARRERNAAAGNAALSPPGARELAYRADDGIEVALLRSAYDNRLTVTVSDMRSGERFALDAAPHEALDVFHHPYAYGLHKRSVAGLDTPLEPATMER